LRFLLFLYFKISKTCKLGLLKLKKKFFLFRYVFSFLFAFAFALPPLSLLLENGNRTWNAFLITKKIYKWQIEYGEEKR